jgi:pimeloyl-ACP methyl ester carboxylesterase
VNALWHRCGGDSLMVLLPGAYMAASDIVENGVFESVERHRLALDLCVPDLGLDAVSTGEALPAVQRSILEPARANYRRVWLGGISLGGLLSLCQKADHPATVDGLCLIAPYPGSRLTTRAIENAGGLDAWEADDEQRTDPEFRAWNWLKSPASDCPTFIGYGLDDRFAEGMNAMASRFPESNRSVVPGGHDWSAWRQLWEDFVGFILRTGHFSIRP